MSETGHGVRLPKFQGAKTSSQRNLPVTIIGRRGLKGVFQIERIDVEGVDEMRSISQIHRRTIEIDQHPFVRIEAERLREFATVQQKSILRTEKSAARIRRIDVHPEFLLLADATNAG